MPQQQQRQRQLQKHRLLKLLLLRHLQKRHPLLMHQQLRSPQLKNKKLKNQRLKNRKLITSKQLKRQETMPHNRILPPMTQTLLRPLLRLRKLMLKMMGLKRHQPAVRRQKKPSTRPRTTTGTQMRMIPTWLKASEHKSEIFRQIR